MAVKEVSIKKKLGGVRKLGIPTILDRIGQEVVKAHLERIVEPQFHDSSYGYRPKRNCHQAFEKPGPISKVNGFQGKKQL